MKWHRLPPCRCPSAEGRAGCTSSPPLGTRFGVTGTCRGKVTQEKPVAMGERRGRTELDNDCLCLCATAPIACPQRRRDRKVPSPGPGEVTGITELGQRLSSALGNPGKGKASQCPPSTGPALATTLLPGRAGHSRGHRAVPNPAPRLLEQGKHRRRDRVPAALTAVRRPLASVFLFPAAVTPRGGLSPLPPLLLARDDAGPRLRRRRNPMASQLPAASFARVKGECSWQGTLCKGLLFSLAQGNRPQASPKAAQQDNGTTGPP